jgi:hypothetical protein
MEIKGNREGCDDVGDKKHDHRQSVVPTSRHRIARDRRLALTRVTFAIGWIPPPLRVVGL